ncbi:hypothetical protein Tco_1536841 [Tanacetum coccineum]
MSHKINYVHPANLLISWMQTRSLILSIHSVLMKARFLQTSSTTCVATSVCIFRLPQATNNNYAGFVDAPTFSQMVPFYRNALGFSLTLISPSNSVSKGLP